LIALQQTAIGDYRQEVLDLLYQRCGEGFAVWCGEEYFDATVRTRIRFAGRRTRTRNVFLLGRRLGWQREVIRPLIGADVAIVEFNPRLLSVWPVLVARRLLGRRTVLWGHAWSRSGEHSRTDVARQAMRSLADVVLVYTEQQRRELSRRIPAARIVAAPNAVYRRSQIEPLSDGEPRHVLYAGRLVPSKKPRLLAEAFLWAADRGLREDVRLLMAGDGPERRTIERLRGEHRSGDRIDLLGHVAPPLMREQYARALCSVSPGYVGLSIVQSLSFGVPMVYSRDEPHAPEIEAARDGFNAVGVPSDDAPELGRAILALDTARDEWIARRPAIADDCRERYSAELMADRILEAAGR
jgi:glycosyltransferase involved in cell wall biosynthesis